MTHYYLAEAMYLNRRDQIAAAHLRLAIGLNPNNTEILASAGWQRAREGDWEEARRYSLRAIELNPKHADWFRIVPFMVYFRAGEY